MICNLKWVRLNLQMPVPELEKALDFVCLNFANGDMVDIELWLRHKSREAVDKCVKVITTALAHDYTRSCNRRPRQL
jgi:bisphosphoglycerate-independent phosphoglycerate mutase (AlkP superfamily)